MPRPSKEEYYLGIAEQISKRGTCLRRMVGAVIVKDDSIVTAGYVGSPRGLANCIDIGKCLRKELGIPSGERYELCRSLHAEQNAIINAARNGSNILKGVMYLFDEKIDSAYPKQSDSYGPCSGCKKEIINAGIEKVIIKSGHKMAILNLEDIKKELSQEELTIKTNLK